MPTEALGRVGEGKTIGSGIEPMHEVADID
jgi:hypothetical protein